MGQFRWIGCGLLLAGCVAPGNRVEWKGALNGPAEISQDINGERVVRGAVRKDEKDAVVDFHGKTFVFRNRSDIKDGTLQYERLRVRINELDVTIDPTGLRIRSEAFKLGYDWRQLGKKMIIEGNTLRIEK